MLTKLEHNEINDSLLSFIISSIKNKLTLFDYIKEEDFKDMLKSDNFIVYKSEHAIFFCEALYYSTGLKAMSVSVVRYEQESDKIDHLKECLSLIETEAKRLGFDRTILEGRIGWKKVFSDYDVEKITLFKNL